MPITYPSRILSLVDIPEPRNLKVEFVYNLYTSDESINDTGLDVPVDENKKGNKRKLTKNDKIPIEAAPPRFAKITWSPTIITNRNKNRTTIPRTDNVNIFNEKNAKSMQTELSFSNFDFSAVNFQDTGLDNKLFSLIEASAAARGIEVTSLTELAKSLNEYTDATIDGNVLVDITNNSTSCGALRAASVEKNEIRQKNIYEELKNIVLNVNINNKVIGTIVQSVADDSFNMFSDEMISIRRSAASIQRNAISRSSSTLINSSDLDTGFIPLKIKRVRPNTNSFDLTSIHIAGYLIEKSEIRSDGTILVFKPILVDGSITTTFIDVKIKYGAVYKYKVKAVAVLSLPSIDTAGFEVIATGLISSQASHAKVIHTIETIPPSSPADFKVSWDYSISSARLMWSLPVNRQRDIKYFQIFRRKTIFDPFELIKMFDFNDSDIILTNFNSIESSLKEKMSSPKTFFIDEEFTKDQNYIYAVVSVDAHGLSSNFSMQFSVSFNIFENKINTKLVSRSGAPLAYPNMYLNVDTFIDTIKTSAFSRLNVYFDPEYLKIVNSSDEDLNLLPLDDQFGRYILQMINTDFQSSQNIEFSIEDRRTSNEKSPARGGSKRNKAKSRRDRQPTRQQRYERIFGTEDFEDARSDLEEFGDPRTSVSTSRAEEEAEASGGSL
jgi:hypothetical protein